MTRGETSDLTAAWARAKRPVQPPPMPPVNLRVRLRTTPWLHGLLPRPLAIRRAERLGAMNWERYPDEQQRARAAMEAIVAGTERADEAEELARQYMVESEVHRMLFWRPLRTARMSAESEAQLNNALQDERGILLSSCHTGPVFQTMSVIAAQDRGAFCVAAPWFFQAPSHDQWGRRLARWWSVAQARREHLIPSVGAYPLLRLLLGQGELVWLLFDMPGSRETQFLGKRVMVSSSSARLASETGALILPLRARREGYDTWVDVAEPLNPRSYANAEELHDALAKVHERWILDSPATLEDPRRRGAWEEGATASGWNRPASTPASMRPEASDERSRLTA